MAKTTVKSDRETTIVERNRTGEVVRQTLVDKEIGVTFITEFSNCKVKGDFEALCALVQNLHQTFMRVAEREKELKSVSTRDKLTKQLGWKDGLAKLNNERGIRYNQASYSYGRAELTIRNTGEMTVGMILDSISPSAIDHYSKFISRVIKEFGRRRTTIELRKEGGSGKPASRKLLRRGAG